jgi:hypothetical protein
VSDTLLAIDWLIAATFVAAGTLKLAHRRQFAAEIADYRLLPASLTGIVAAGLPVVEIAAGVAVLFSGARLAGTLVLLACLAIFTAAVVVNLLRGRTDLSCACFGRRSRHIDWAIPARNGLMAAGLLAATLVPTKAAVPTAAASTTVVIGLALLWVVWESRALTTPIEGDTT